MSTSGNLVYEEHLTSNRTEALFLTLTVFFGVLFAWRKRARKPGRLSVLSLLLSTMFLFYSVNFRKLVIRLRGETLELTFGLFTWKVPIDNIQACDLDEIPTFMRLGGAGIHFMLIRNRYRASFNFLEHPQVVIQFKEKVGPVRDISFSTRYPDEVIRLIQETVSANAVA
jgi:hypothetical protein